MSKFKQGDKVYVIPGSCKNRHSEGVQLSVTRASQTQVETGLAQFWTPDRLVLESEATPCQRLGLAVGDWIEVTKECSFVPTFNVGDTLKLSVDDNTELPFFLRQSDGREDPECIAEQNVGGINISPMEFERLDAVQPENNKDPVIVKAENGMIERDGTERNDAYTEHKPVPAKLAVSEENQELWQRFHRGWRK